MGVSPAVLISVRNMDSWILGNWLVIYQGEAMKGQKSKGYYMIKMNRNKIKERRWHQERWSPWFISLQKIHTHTHSILFILLYYLSSIRTSVWYEIDTRKLKKTPNLGFTKYLSSYPLTNRKNQHFPYMPGSFQSNLLKSPYKQTPIPNQCSRGSYCMYFFLNPEPFLLAIVPCLYPEWFLVFTHSLIHGLRPIGSSASLVHQSLFALLLLLLFILNLWIC